MTVVAWLSSALALLPLVMAAANLRYFTRPTRLPAAGTAVSILIPARDEAAGIEQAVRGALASTGVAVEVLVLDDNSSDDTAARVTAIAAQDPRVQLCSAPPLPPGWAGKQRACHLLAARARHPVLMFVDADVRLAPQAAAFAAGRLLADDRLGLVSGFPHERTVGVAEQLVIPWIHLLLLGYLPMWRMQASESTAYGAACGQWIVVRQRAYLQVGGHAAARASRHDGLSLPRTFRAAGWRTDLFDGSALAECRMYHDLASVWRGFAKSAGEGMATSAALPVWTVLLGLGHVLPAPLVVAGLVAGRSDVALVAGIGLAANALLRWVLCRRLRQSALGAWLHPLGAAFVLANQWVALVGHWLGRPSTWRGRSYQPRVDAWNAVFAGQRAACAASGPPDLALRQDRLARLLAMTDRIAPELERAASADFGHRAWQVTRLADVLVTRSAIRHAQRHVRHWMKARRVSTALTYFPAHGRVQAQPLGVVGIVSPWNYPYQLSIGPAVSALAAGNRVMIKPSEATPRVSALLQQAVAEHYAPDEMAVVTGDADVARAFTALPFDHLLFTGSTAVGRHVALAAARNLTPVTLELGGKSPAILNADCDLDAAVPRLMAGKLFNTGQTCIAPDYVLAHASLVGRLEDAMRAATQRMYPTIAGNADYSNIVDGRHVARLDGLLQDARDRGARVVPLHPESTTQAAKMPPYAVFDVDDSMQVMQEEIFGPVLPVLSYQHLDDAIAYVNRHDRPLALYWFGRRRADRDAVLARTVSGGVTVNDCLLHVAQEGMPFGGVGASGHGSYHGEHGFRTFSHDKPVFHQSPYAGTAMMAPPYGRAFDVLARLVRWLG